MTRVLLIYPFFIPRRDRSVFRFPPLGIAYVASSLREAGHDVTLIDCTFLDRQEALRNALAVRASVVGIYCMVTMLDETLWFAQELRERAELLVAGGPLPTCDPNAFLDHFDIVVRGEGENTMIELLAAHESGVDLNVVPGIAYRPTAGPQAGARTTFTADRPFVRNLDRIPLPARDLLPNDEYIKYGRKMYGYSITTVMSTRGCPYRCAFCSNVVFGGTYRERLPARVVDEIQEALALGYDRISFADDVFTMRESRVVSVCDEILRRGLQFKWECLGRVDSIDAGIALKMKQAGCTRVYFGIESADEGILQLMNKKITAEMAREAVEVTRAAGLEVGAFFILFYPGETEETVLRTLHFAASLRLDYLGVSVPYPLPGTALFERIRNKVNRDWRPADSLFGSHVLIFESDFSETKIWFGLLKGHAQFRINQTLGRWAPILLKPFEAITNAVFHLMK